MNTHHNFGPSSLERRLLCPGSYRAELNLPEETNEYAEEGHFLHECVKNSSFKVGDKECDIEQKELVKKCLEVAGELISGASIIEREIKLSIIGSNFEELLFGTADLLAVFDEKSGLTEGQKIVIADYKFGRNPVAFTENNIQLAAYALAAMQTYGILKCEVYIIQPRINRHDTYTFTQPESLLKIIEGIIAECLKPDALCYASEKACTYCKARNTCPGAVGMLTKIAEAKQELQIEHIHEISDPIVLSKWLDVWKLAKKIGASIEDSAKEYALQNGGKCGDYVIQKKSGTREITDTVQAFELGKDVVSQVDYLSICTPSASKYEKLFCEKMQTQAEAQGMKVTLTSLKKKFNDVMAPVISHKAETVSLVRIE